MVASERLLSGQTRQRRGGVGALFCGPGAGLANVGGVRGMLGRADGAIADGGGRCLGDCWRWLGVGAERRGIGGGAVRCCWAAMVAAHAPAHGRIGVWLHVGYWGHWRHWRYWRRWRVLLLLRASHGAVARELRRRRRGRRNRFGGHGGGECCDTMDCVPARGRVRDDAPTDVRGNSAGNAGGYNGFGCIFISTGQQKPRPNNTILHTHQAHASWIPSQGVGWLEPDGRLGERC